MKQGSEVLFWTIIIAIPALIECTTQVQSYLVLHGVVSTCSYGKNMACFLSFYQCEESCNAIEKLFDNNSFEIVYLKVDKLLHSLQIIEYNYHFLNA